MQTSFSGSAGGGGAAVFDEVLVLAMLWFREYRER
jgi:hypothetical protein